MHMNFNKLLVAQMGLMLVFSSCAVLDSRRKQSYEYVESMKAIGTPLGSNDQDLRVGQQLRYDIEGLNERETDDYFGHPAVVQRDALVNCPTVIEYIDKATAKGYVSMDETIDPEYTKLTKPIKLNDLKAACQKQIARWQTQQINVCAKHPIFKIQTLSGGRWVDTGGFRLGAYPLIYDCRQFPRKSNLGEFKTDAKALASSCTSGPAEFMKLEDYQENFETHRRVLFWCHLNKTRVWKKHISNSFQE